MAVRAPVLVSLTCMLASGGVALGATLPIHAYTVAEGLAHDHVSQMYRDSHDFLWICTDEGLSRFDGHRFVNYTIANGLPHIHVNDIIEARSGDYWVATDGGVTLFRPGSLYQNQKFRTFKPDGPPEALFVNAIVEEPDGAVLVGTQRGLYRLESSAGAARFERITMGAPRDDAGDSSINTLHLDRERTIWVGTSRGLFHRDRGGAWSRFTGRDGLPHEFVDRIVSDPEGRLWICTRYGLARVAEKPRTGTAVDLTITTANGLPNRDVRTILFAPDGRRWIGTLGGLVEWNGGPPSPENFRVYTDGDGLTDDEIYTTIVDSAGNIWLGTRRGGVMRLKRSGFQTFEKGDGFVPSGDDELLETSSGNVCVAAIGDPRRAVHCFDGRRFDVAIPDLPADVVAGIPNSSQSTIVDHTGALWISSARGLFRFATTKPVGRAHGARPDLCVLPGVESRRVFEDGNHDIWVTTFFFSRSPFSLMRWRRANLQLEDWTSVLPREARERGITALAEGPAGQLWIGLARPGGLFRWRNGSFEKVDRAPEGTVYALYPDHTGRLWIASGETGLGRIDDPAGHRIAVRYYNRSHGLASNEVWCVTEDRYGRIYAGTVRGVDRLDPGTGRMIHYSSADGLAKGDIRAALRDRGGDLWFLSRRGLSRLIPEHDVGRPAPTARITAISLGGTPRALSELGELHVSPLESTWNRNSIQIEFSAIDFQAPEQLRYQFLLEGGATSAWTEPSPDSSVRFSNLAPGRYRFLVRAIGPDGLPGTTPASFAFTITPPVWRRWWFQAVTTGLLLALAYLGYRFTLERRLQLERVRSRIATDLHDDIGASLSRIALMSEVVKGRVNTQDLDSQRILGEMAESSRALVESMSDIVWSIDPRRDNLHDVVARLRAFGSDVLESRGVNWSCAGPSDALGHGLSPDQRRQLYLIFKEAIHNIARHSRAQNVTLRITLSDNYLRAEIQDDGCGGALDGGVGLGIASMRRRANRLGGKFGIAERPGGGTAATVEFRLTSKNA